MHKNIDFTLLKASASKKDIEELCVVADKNNYKSVCVNPFWVSYASNLLQDSSVLICTVIGFPLGANTLEVKVFEAINALENGADEIDMVINIGALKDGNTDYVLQEIKSVREVSQDKTLKVIIETALLTDMEKELATKLCLLAGVDFVKTSTGFSTSGATIEDVKLLYSIVKGQAEVKASGGIKTFEDAQKMLEAGATRIGTSSQI